MTGVISDSDTQLLWEAMEANPGLELQVDLPAQQVRFSDTVVSFEIDEYTKWRLMEGLDDIGITLQNEPAIAAFEARRQAWRPTTLPAKGV